MGSQDSTRSMRAYQSALFTVLLGKKRLRLRLKPVLFQSSCWCCDFGNISEAMTDAAVNILAEANAPLGATEDAGAVAWVLTSTASGLFDDGRAWILSWR